MQGLNNDNVEYIVHTCFSINSHHCHCLNISEHSYLSINQQAPQRPINSDMHTNIDIAVQLGIYIQHLQAS